MLNIMSYINQIREPQEKKCISFPLFMTIMTSNSVQTKERTSKSIKYRLHFDGKFGYHHSIPFKYPWESEGLDCQS